MTCNQCNEEMRFIKAGISQRTGKPYNSFWSCPNKCRQQGANQSIGSKVIQAYKQVDNDKKWEDIRKEKNENIKWNMALKLAVEAWYHGKIEKDAIINLAKWIYEQEPINYDDPANGYVEEYPEQNYF
jgi:hypothetical protein